MYNAPIRQRNPEAFEYFEQLRRGGGAMRTLEAEEAAEGVPMIPVAALEEILSMKPELSLIDRLGIRRFQSDRSIAQIPVEVTGQALPAAVLEEGAFIANEPAFALRSLTLIKYGSMVTATEELLEDQALFMSWFPAACARRLALQENTILNTRLAAGGTLGVHLAATHTLTEAQLITAYQVMPDPWREGAKVIMHDLTANAVRGLLIATPRAFNTGGAEFFWSSTGEGRFLGLPLLISSHVAPITTAADAVPVIYFVNPDGIIFVEHGGLEIVRDDYGDALNGRTRFFPYARFNIAIGDPLASVKVTDHA